jgi:hypothetical protein
MSTAFLLVFACCISAFLTGCGSGTGPLRVTGNLSSNDVVQIERAVHEGMIRRLGSARRRPIKSIEITTNNLYEIQKRLDWPSGQPIPVEARTNIAVDVWYADAHARWGEAGYTLERSTNGWNIISELFR